MKRLITFLIVTTLFSVSKSNAAIKIKREFADIAFVFVNNTGEQKYTSWQSSMPEELAKRLSENFLFSKKKLIASQQVETAIINSDRFMLRDIAVDQKLDFILLGYAEENRVKLFLYSRYQNSFLLKKDTALSTSYVESAKQFILAAKPIFTALALKRKGANTGITSKPMIYRERRIFETSKKNRLSVFYLLATSSTTTISPTLISNASMIDTKEAPLVRGLSVQYSRLKVWRHFSPLIGFDYAVPVSRIKDNNDALVTQFWSVRLGGQSYFSIDKNFFLSVGLGGSRIGGGKNSYINSSGKTTGFIISQESTFSGWSAFLLFSAGAKPWPMVSFDAGIRLEYKWLEMNTTRVDSGTTQINSSESISMLVPTIYFGTSFYL